MVGRPSDQFETRRVCANDIDLAVDDFGDPSLPAVVLVMGIGAQRVLWRTSLCNRLVERGLRVIRFDNRDVGESTWMKGMPAPHPREVLRRAVLRRPIEAPYALHDLADDVAGLLDGLRLERAHLVGASLGGMIAQTTAFRHPHRVASLTSIMSSPGGWRSTIGRPRALRALLGPRPRTRAEMMDRFENLYRAIGSPMFPEEVAVMRELGGISWDRGVNPAGFCRQFAAIVQAGDRRAELRQITAPTLVIHGARDRLIPPRGGRATARAIPGARFELIADMAHDLPTALDGALARRIAEHVCGA